MSNLSIELAEFLDTSDVFVNKLLLDADDHGVWVVEAYDEIFDQAVVIAMDSQSVETAVAHAKMFWEAKDKILYVSYNGIIYVANTMQELCSYVNEFDESKFMILGWATHFVWDKIERLRLSLAALTEFNSDGSVITQAFG